MEEKKDKATQENKSSANPAGKAKTKSAGAKKSTGKKKAPAESKIKKELQEANEKLAEMQDKYLRLSAEYDNYRRRTLKEKMELTKTGGEKVLLNILPVMDNLDRAMASIDQAKDMEAVKVGLELIVNKFKEFIEQNGIKEIPAIEEVFDTDLHEAITKFPTDKEEMKGKIVDVIEKGYYLHDKVLRFAKVVVGE